MALTSTERVQRHRARKRAALAASDMTRFLFPELAPAPANTAPIAEPRQRETTAAARASSRETSRNHRERKRVARMAGKLATPGSPDRPDVPGLMAWLTSSLKVSQGRMAGEPFKVLPWQAEFLTRALAPKVFDAALSMGRGNGKSTFVASVMAAALVGPLRQPRGEILLVASSFAQARVVFEHLRYFIEPWIAARALDWKIDDSSQRASIMHKPTGARARCIGSDPKRAHGLAPYFAILDEPAQWPANTGARMLAAIETAAGKVPGSRRWSIGTRHDDSEHWFSKLLRGSADYAMVYAGDIEDPHNPEQWEDANPSLDAMPDLRERIEAESSKAKQDPDRLASFKALRLNGGVADVQHRALLDADVWARIESDREGGEFVRGEGEYVLGVDLGGGAAMSAFAGYWLDSGRVEAIAAFPREPDLRARGIADGVGNLYERMAERGELFRSGTHAVDLVSIFASIRDRWGLPICLVADRWKARDLQEAWTRAKLPVPTGLVWRGQGYKDGGEDVASFRRAVLEGHVSPSRNLLLRAAMREARTVADLSRNEKLAKSTEGGRRARARDDAAAAAILAVAVGYRKLVREGRDGNG